MPQQKGEVAIVDAIADDPPIIEPHQGYQEDLNQPPTLTQSPGNASFRRQPHVCTRPKPRLARDRLPARGPSGGKEALAVRSHRPSPGAAHLDAQLTLPSYSCGASGQRIG